MKARRIPLTGLQFALTATCVLVAVLPHLPRLPWLFSIPILGLVAGRWLQRRRGAARAPSWLKLGLILLFPVLTVVHYGNLFGRNPGSALACAMLALKLIETESRRDARAAICFASFVLMSELLFDHGLAISFILFAALTLYLATLRALQSVAVPVPGASRSRLVADLRSASIGLAAAVPLALCAFVFLPRLGSPLWGVPSDAETRTGLGDSMAPGLVQNLLIDDSPAFRVTFDGTVPARSHLYWRGPVLWHFDGTTWSRPDIFASYGNVGRSLAEANRIGYQISMEPSGRHWLLALDVPVTVPTGAVRGADMSLVSRSRVDRLRRYHVVSALDYRLEPVLDPAHRRLALQLPYDFDPRARELAHRWRNEFNTTEGVIKAALGLFHERFTYTLDAPLLGRDSVDDFLFHTRRGFCEHFASAFTFLMRAAGIPARVVTGYQGGYFSNTGNYLVVRQSDAHAWSEVWLDGRGWVRVDPTAAVSPARVELGAGAAAGASAPWYQAAWLSALRNRLDLINRFWNEAIVQFNALRQQNMLTPLGIDKADYGELMTLLVVFSSVLLGLFAWWTLRAPQVPVDALDAAYARLCRKLSRAGLVREPSEGPYTYARRVAATDINSNTLQQLLAAYTRLRYAQALAPATAVRAFDQRVRALRIAVRPPG